MRISDWSSDVCSSDLGERFWNCWLRPGLVRGQERAIRDRALEVLNFVDLTPLKDEYAGRLSGGQKKLLELARTLMAEPRLVLIVEPGARINRTPMRPLRSEECRVRTEGGRQYRHLESATH